MIVKTDLIKFRIKGLTEPEVFETKTKYINTGFVVSISEFGTWANWGTICEIQTTTDTFYVKATIQQVLAVVNPV